MPPTTSLSIGRWVRASAVCLGIALSGSSLLLARQNPTLQGHPDDYAARRHRVRRAPVCRSIASTAMAALVTAWRASICAAESSAPRRTDLQLRTVITNGFPNAGMPAFKLDAAELTGLVAYIRNMNTFDTRLDESRRRGARPRGVRGQGRVPELSSRQQQRQPESAGPVATSALVRSAGSLERSLRDPSSQMIPINRPVRAVTRDGKVINGRRLNEDTYTVQLTDEEGRLHSLVKSDLREYTISTKSTMPSYEKELTPEELADVVSYLLSLKGR